MRVYKDDYYGADADGNRGVTSIEYELESCDTEDIIEKIKEDFFMGEFKGTKTIELYSYELDEYISVEVDIENYLEELLDVFEKEDLDLTQEEKNDYIKEVKEYLDNHIKDIKECFNNSLNFI